MYDIAAKPTKYNGVQFRSRLEARWAAFFDLCKWRWDYEPIDLRGWVPDFSIKTPFCPVLAEVKPIDSERNYFKEKQFSKAVNHWQKCQILLLGLGPAPPLGGVHQIAVGTLCDPPNDVDYGWVDVHEFLTAKTDQEELWREAGNLVQWQPYC